MALKGTYASDEFKLTAADSTFGINSNGAKYLEAAQESDSTLAAPVYNAKTLKSKGVEGYFTTTKTLNASAVKTDITVNLSGGTLETYKGGKKKDTITVAADATKLTSVEGGAGDDTFNLSGDNTKLTLNGGAGKDTFNLTNKVSTALGGAGDDTFNITAQIGTAAGEAGNDTFNINSDAVVTAAVLGAGNDIVKIAKGGAVTTIDASGGGKNTVEIEAGAKTTATTTYLGGTGVDSIVAKGASESADFYTLGTIQSGKGNDYVELGSGVTVTKLEAEEGNDTVYIKAGAKATNVNLGAGNDTATVEGTGTLTLGAGNDKVYVKAGANLTINDITEGSNTIYMDSAEFNRGNLTFNGTTATFTNGSNTSTDVTITFTSGANSVITIINSTNAKDILYKQITQFGTADTATITSANYGTTNVVLTNSDNLKTIITDKRRGAMNLTAASSALTSVQASGKADYIDVTSNNTLTESGAGGVSITSGAGADTIKVHAGDNLVITDFTRGNNAKKADSLTLDTGLSIMDKQQVVNGDDVTLTFGTAKGGTGTDSNTLVKAATVKIIGGAYDGSANAEAKQGILINGTAGLFADPTTKFISDAKKATIDSSALTFDTDTTTISYANSQGPITLTGGFGKGSDNGKYTAIASKGGDIVVGAPNLADQLISTTDTSKVTGFNFQHDWNNDTCSFSSGTGKLTVSLSGVKDATGYTLNQIVLGAENDATGKFTKIGGQTITDGKATVTSGNVTLALKGLDSATTDTTTLTVTDNVNTFSGQTLGTDTGIINLNGSAGNDLIIGNVAGGTLSGGAGNDSLRGGAQNAAVREAWEGDYGAVSLTGGAGNDYFIITGEANTTIEDYSNPQKAQYTNDAAGKAALKAAQTAGGNDQIIFSYDKASAKDPQAQVEINSSSIAQHHDAQASVAATDSSPSIAAQAAYDDIQFNVSASTYLGTNAINDAGYETDGMFRYGEGVNVVLKGIHDGDLINAQIGGVKYSQTYHIGSTAATADGNFNAFLNPAVTKITGADKNSVLVGSQITTQITGGSKNDTLIANNSEGTATLQGGAGKNVYIANGAVSVKSADLKNDKFVVTTYTSTFNFDGKNLVTGNYTIADAEGQNITFTYDKEVATVNKGKVKVTKTTEQMTRLFSTAATASVVSGGASTYLYVGGDIDKNVVEVKAGAKSTQLSVDANGGYEALTKLQKVTGGAKAENIYVDGNGAAQYVTVATGKGNDTLSGYHIYVTDFTAGTAVTKATKTAEVGDYKAGDILTQTFTLSTGIDGRVGVEGITFNGQNVLIDEGSIVLKGMKDKQIWAYTGGDELTLVTLHDTSEYQLGVSTDKNVNKTQAAKGYVVDMSEVDPTGTYKSLDTTKNTKGAEIYTGEFIKKVEAGKAVDTIFAGGAVPGSKYVGATATFVTVTSGAGADFLVFGQAQSVSSDTALTLASNDTLKSKLESDTTVWQALTEGENASSSTTLDNVTYFRKGTADNYSYSSETTFEGVSSASYTITDYAADKLVFASGTSIAKVEFATGDGQTGSTVLSGKGANQIVTAYSDVTITLSGTNTITLNNVAVKTSAKSATPTFTTADAASFKLTRASAPDSKTFFSLDYIAETPTITAADGTDFFDLTGAKAKNIVAASTKAVTIDGSNLLDADSKLASVTSAYKADDSALKKVNAITYYGGVGWSAATQGTTDRDGTNMIIDFTDVSAAAATVAGAGTSTTLFKVAIDLSKGSYNDPNRDGKGVAGSIFTAEEGSDTYVLNINSDGTVISVEDADGITSGATSYSTTTTLGKAVTFKDKNNSTVTLNFSFAGIEDPEAISDVTLTQADVSISYETKVSAYDANETGKAVMFTGSAKNDVYYGNGAKDTIYFTKGGNNTIFGGGRATASLGAADSSGNDVIVLKDGDDLTLYNYSTSGKGKGGTDKIILSEDFSGSNDKSKAVKPADLKSGAISSVVFSGDDLVINFEGQEGTIADDVKASATLTLKNYNKNSQAVSIAQNYISAASTTKKAATIKNVAISAVTYGKDSEGNVTVTGSKGNDIIELGTALGINYVEGSAGNDIYKVGSGEGEVTIKGFTTKSTLLDEDGNPFFNSEDLKSASANIDYSDKYIYLGGDNATLFGDESTVILTGVKKGKADVGATTNAIKVSTEKKNNSVTLSNQQNVTLAAAPKVTSFDLTTWGDDEEGVTKTFDASKVGSKVTLSVEANASLTSYKSGKGADNLTLSDAAGANKVDFTYQAQKGITDTITFTTTGANALTLTAANNNTSLAGGATTDGNNVTLDIMNKKAAGGNIKLVDDSRAGGIFNYTVQLTTTKGEAVGEKYADYDIKAADSGTTFLYTFTANQYVSSTAISNLGTQATGNDVKSETYALKDAQAAAKAAEFLGTDEVKALTGTSFGTDKWYTVNNAKVKFGASLGTDGKVVSTTGSETSITAVVSASNTSLDGKSGYTVDSIKIGETTYTGNTVYAKYESDTTASLAFSSSAADGYTKYTFGATKDGLNYQLDIAAAAEQTSIQFATTSNFGTAIVRELKDSSQKGTATVTVGAADTTGTNSTTVAALTEPTFANDAANDSTQTATQTFTIGDDTYTLTYTVTKHIDNSDANNPVVTFSTALTSAKKGDNTMTVSSGTLTLDDSKTITLGATDGSATTATWNTSVKTGSFTLPDSTAARTIVFATDAYGDSTDEIASIGGAADADKNTAGFQYEVKEGSNVVETVTVAKDTTGSTKWVATWEKDITAFTFQAESIEGSANEYYAFSFGTDVFGNSNKTVNLGTAYSSNSDITGEDAAKAVLGFTDHGLTELKTDSEIKDGVIAIADAKGTNASDAGIAGNATITADSFKAGAEVVYTTANTYQGTVKLGKATATDGWEDETVTAVLDFNKDAKFATVESVSIDGKKLSGTAVTDISSGKFTSDSVEYTYAKVEDGKSGKVNWTYTDTTTIDNDKGFTAELSNPSYEDPATTEAAFEERAFTETEKLFNDFVTGNSLSDLVDSKVAVDVNSTTKDDTDAKSYVANLVSSNLTTNKKN